MMVGSNRKMKEVINLLLRGLSSPYDPSTVDGLFITILNIYTNSLKLIVITNILITFLI